VCVSLKAEKILMYKKKEKQLVDREYEGGLREKKKNENVIEEGRTSIRKKKRQPFVQRGDAWF